MEDAIKSWFGLFNSFLGANQIVIAENIHASAFSEITKSRELFRRQVQVVTSSRLSILFTGRELQVREKWTLLKLSRLIYQLHNKNTNVHVVANVMHIGISL